MKVKLNRKLSKFHKYNDTGDANVIYSKDNRVGLSCALDGETRGLAKPKHGLDYKELETWFAEFAGIDSNIRNNEFKKEVDEYFFNYSVEIPHTGKVLDITILNEKDEEIPHGEYRANIKKLAGKCRPKSPQDYIAYMVAINNTNKVAKTAGEFQDNRHYVYISYPETEVETATKTVGIKNEANTVFSKLVLLDAKKYLYLLKAAGLKELSQTSIGLLTNEECYLRLDKLKDNYPEAFLKVHNDKDSQDKFFVYKALEAKALVQKGSKFVYGLQTIGNINEVLIWMNDIENSQEMLVLKDKVETYEKEMLDKRFR